MATLSVQNISRSGMTLSTGAAAGGGDEFPNDGRTFIYVNNGGGGSITVTTVTQQTVDGKAVADDSISVPNAQARYIGPFPPSIYNDVNDRVQVTYSGVTSVTVAAVRLP